jgi:hypothetical protein
MCCRKATIENGRLIELNVQAGYPIASCIDGVPYHVRHHGNFRSFASHAAAFMLPTDSCNAAIDDEHICIRDCRLGLHRDLGAMQLTALHPHPKPNAICRTMPPMTCMHSHRHIGFHPHSRPSFCRFRRAQDFFFTLGTCTIALRRAAPPSPPPASPA